MADSLTGGLGPPVLGGYFLSRAAVIAQDVVERPLKSVVDLATGNRREALHYEGAGYPTRKVKHAFTLRYANVSAHYDLIEELLALPGPLPLIVWKRLKRAYRGDGSRTTFYLPTEVASHFTSGVAGLVSGYPPSFAATEVTASATEARVEIDGAPLTVLHKSTGDYSAGTPAADEVWFLNEGQEFKVGTAPADGEHLFIRYVPRFQVYDAGEISKSYPAAAVRREPLDLVLLER